MKKYLKKLFKENSPYLVVVTLAEIVLAFFAILSFVYTDSLQYSDSIIIQQLGVEKLLQSIYSSTWWALILLLLSFTAIFSLACIVFKKMDYLFLSISIWIIMAVIAINLNNSLIDNILLMLLFVPIIILNIISYKTQYNKIMKRKKTR